MGKIWCWRLMALFVQTDKSIHNFQKLRKNICKQVLVEGFFRLFRGALIYRKYMQLPIFGCWQQYSRDKFDFLT